MPERFKTRRVTGWLVCAYLLTATMLFAIDRDGLIGTWEGESKCTVPNSPCHDEHVIYEVVGDRRKTDIFKMDGYKVVEGKQRELMGSLDCTLGVASSTLTCTGHSEKQDLWEFKIAEGRMVGTLVVGAEKQLFRKITVEKHEAK
ncbi:MAG: hypothetical protein H0X25_02065 [Acidobacteriales bacterium]|nr:hypothetical protein [Terriglobales bacterium]